MKERRMKMKSKTWILMGLMATLILSNGNIIVYAEENKQLYLDISSEENLLFSKYDVAIYFDDEFLDTFSNGAVYTKMMDVTIGKHTLSFYDEDLSFKSTQDITTNEDCTFQCTLVSYSDEIKVKDCEIISGTERSSIEMADVESMSLYDAKNELKEAGFVNIKVEETEGTVWDESNWIVLEQNVKEGKKIDKNYEIMLLCQKIDDYLKDNFVGKTLNDAMKKATDIGYVAHYKNSRDGETMDSVISNFSEIELSDWKVSEAESIQSDSKEVKLELTYIGKVNMPDVIGRCLSDALDILRKEEMSSIKYEGEGETTIFDTDNWEVVSQSIEPNVVINADEEIKLICHSYESNEDEQDSYETTENKNEDLDNETKEKEVTEEEIKHGFLNNSNYMIKESDAFLDNCAKDYSFTEESGFSTYFTEDTGNA